MGAMPGVERYHDPMPGSARAIEGQPFWVIGRPYEDRAIAGKLLGNFVSGFDRRDDAPRP